ncbi:uncharacterized protein LOC114265690 [Camellia sinensis]|uniref:uncharacterized protein LOC114265690 n=1 Tax=Camellia sinensis TaxID=4442 RepID=UPI00103615FF|nr:uncharacterized protein LOC114265690 [Camellia sinensis]
MTAHQILVEYPKEHEYIRDPDMQQVSVEYADGLLQLVDSLVQISLPVPVAPVAPLSATGRRRRQASCLLAPGGNGVSIRLIEVAQRLKEGQSCIGLALAETIMSLDAFHWRETSWFAGSPLLLQVWLMDKLKVVVPCPEYLARSYFFRPRFHCCIVSLCVKVWLPIYLCIKSNDCKWEIRDSPAKKQRCEGCASPPPPPSPSPSPSPLCSSAEEKEDPRSKIVFYNYDDDSDVEDDSDGMHEFTDKEFQEYDRQLTQSDGFDVMYFPRSFGFGGTEPVFNLDEIADDLKTFSELALKQYNDKEFKKLEFVKVVKANMGLCAGFKYYITFDVKDADAVDGGTMEFEACVWDGIGHTDVLISRLKIST